MSLPSPVCNDLISLDGTREQRSRDLTGHVHWATVLQLMAYCCLAPTIPKGKTYLRYSLIYFACVRERNGCLLLVGYMDWAGEQKCWQKGHWATKEQQGRSACGQQCSSPAPQYSSQPLLCKQVLAAHIIVRLLLYWHLRPKDKAIEQANLRYTKHISFRLVSVLNDRKGYLHTLSLWLGLGAAINGMIASFTSSHKRTIQSSKPIMLCFICYTIKSMLSNLLYSQNSQ